jgi:hypothetical protein
MKVESKEPEFKPVVLEITLETLQEVQDFYNIFNHAGILDSTNINGATIRDILTRRRAYVSDNFQPFSDSLDAYYERKLSL